MIEEFKPLELMYPIIAVMGGLARYLNSYINGTPFRISLFVASGFVAGFSGYMFALLGDSLQFPFTVTYVMAGVGGFFGDQTMKFIMEILSKRTIK